MTVRPLLTLLAAGVLSACTVTTVPPPSGAAGPSGTSSPRLAQSAAVANFRTVVRRVEPVAESVCRRQTRGRNCDFNIVIDTRSQPPNAFQTYDERGRPVIGFTASLIREMRNRDEIAFALSHEAAHHIEGHIDQTQSTAVAGAILGTVFGQLAGLDAQGIETVQRVGGTIGARTFSKSFELEADALGARITAAAGYDPLVGVQYFARAPDPGDRFLGTHPPNPDRIATVRRVVGAQ